VFAAGLSPATLYERDDLEVLDQAGCRVRWRPVGATHPRLVPEELSDLR